MQYAHVQSQTPAPRVQAGGVGSFLFSTYLGGGVRLFSKHEAHVSHIPDSANLYHASEFTKGPGSPAPAPRCHQTSPRHSTSGLPQKSSWHSLQVRPPKPGMHWHCPVNCGQDMDWSAASGKRQLSSSPQLLGKSGIEPATPWGQGPCLLPSRPWKRSLASTSSELPRNKVRKEPKHVGSVSSFLHCVTLGVPHQS